MMTKVMAIEWAARGVRVNAIAPGYVQTEFITMLSARASWTPRSSPAGRPWDASAPLRK
jgi:NAD(P)-dependent dehydrogenase (short-subunit alcohol dehydrogenase family)